MSTTTNTGATLDVYVTRVKEKSIKKPLLTNAERKNLIADKKNGTSVASLMEKYNVSKSTVMRLWKRRQEILEHVSCFDDRKHMVLNKLYRPALEVRMLEWVEFVRSKKIKLIINYGALVAAAKKISTKLLKSPPADLSDLEKKRLTNWTPSHGWAKRFVRRNKMVSITVSTLSLVLSYYPLFSVIVPL